MLLATMPSPFLWRNVAVLLLVAANFALAVRLLAGPAAPTQPALGVPLRAIGLVYVVASALLVLLAGLLFCAIEVFDPAPTAWRRAERWTGVQAGMSRPDVEGRLGAPFQKWPTVRDGHAGEEWVYQLRALGAPDEGHVTFETAAPEAPAATMRVVARQPRDDRWALIRGEWIPRGYTGRIYARNVTETAAMLSLVGLLGLALLSLLPFGVAAGWRSWTLYTPLIAALFGFLYEVPQQGGWRFDRMFLLYPAYAVIAGAWLVRLVVVLKSPA